METASEAIYCLAASAQGTIWANARARELGATPRELPTVGGRPVSDLVDEVLRTGKLQVLRGVLGADGPPTTAVARPVEVAGGPGVLLIVGAAEHENGPGESFHAHLVDQVQHSLLPPSLPLLPDLLLSGSYHRASSVPAAGGDWYEAVALGGGRVALVVGDAVGHGVPAAAAMSRLRGAMRSCALSDPSPEVVLSALDALAGEMDDVEGASVFYALFDAVSGRLTYTAAGHPPPLLVRADRSTSFLPVTPRPPLGTVPGAPTPVAETRLEQGETVVLFSDGALGGAAATAPDGPARLAEVAADVLGRPGALDPDAVGELATSIAEALRSPEGWPDDVAVLVAHRPAVTLEPLRLALTAVPAALPGVRRRLGDWLAGLGMGEQDRVGVMVAVGEACANAAEHAYSGGEPGPMHVTADVDVDGLLTVTVRDEGTWRPPDRDPGDRGRGLLIMRQLVDGVTLDESGGTTVTLRMRLRRLPEGEPGHGFSGGTATVTVDRAGECPVVRVDGPVDELSAEQLRIRLLEASRGGTSRVELDLAGVGVFSSAAVRVVLAVARIGEDEGWRLVVHAPAGGVTRHILEISGLGGLVDLV
jgi:anti-anti-sigma factor